jgi:uncharacterized protein DUF1844
MANESEKEEIRVEDRRFFDKDGNPTGKQDQTLKTETPRVTPPGPSRKIDFGSFLLIYLQTALIHLGELDDPIEKKPQVNLDAAREIIDILEMLQDKTRGNLNQQEEQYLEHMLFDLRMRYVEKAKQS